MTSIAHTTGPSSPPLIEHTIGHELDLAVKRFGAREALVEAATGRRWTYRELVDDVDLAARGLLALGVEPGDRVGIWAPNCAEWVIVQFAAARIGAVLVTVNPAYRRHELAYALRQAGIRTLVSATEFKGSDYAAMIADISSDCPDLVDVVLLGTASWDELIDAGRAVDPGRLTDVGSSLSADEPINIQYTSGTTGFPKGATLSHRNILNNGFFVGELLGYTCEDRICVPVPFYHCFGMVMGNLAALSHGSTIVIPGPSFDPAATLRVTAQENCTSLYGVPTMFIAMLNDPTFGDHDYSSLRTGIMAGSPCPVETMKQVIGSMGIEEISICYGMTETSPVSLQTRPDDSLDRRVGTVGTVGPHLEVKIIDPVTGESVQPGVPGELCTRGYSVMLGYWNEPEKTAEAVDADGWMHTGDIAVMDEAGYVNITGRIKDMVIRGGENIYPREIEEFLMTHPDVLDAQVIGVPDEKYGEELMAWIRLRDGHQHLDAAAVREFCSGRLAHYKIPRYVHVTEEFPMTVTGKVRKIDMRTASIDLLGLGEAATTPHA